MNYLILTILKKMELFVNQDKKELIPFLFTKNKKNVKIKLYV